MVLKSCKQDSCRNPWATLHPANDVQSLADSLVPDYNGFYADQPRVSFSSCEQGYMAQSEGAMSVNTYSSSGNRGTVGGDGLKVRMAAVMASHLMYGSVAGFV
jgi:N-acetylglucosamine-6-sulfatase